MLRLRLLPPTPWRARDGLGRLLQPRLTARWATQLRALRLRRVGRSRRALNGQRYVHRMKRFQPLTGMDEEWMPEWQTYSPVFEFRLVWLLWKHTLCRLGV